ncbi:MAG: cation:proton antiporter [Candidatus Methanofastidiosia archaeon]
MDWELIRAILFVIAGLFILAASIGLWRFGPRKNVIYARIHIAGIIDHACILTMLVLLQPYTALVAVAYFTLTPVAFHSIANALHYEEVEK